MSLTATQSLSWCQSVKKEVWHPVRTVLEVLGHWATGADRGCYQHVFPGRGLRVSPGTQHVFRVFSNVCCAIFGTVF